MTTKHSGDDLEDDFIPDDLVALSDDDAPGTARLDDEDVFVDDEGQTPEEDDEGEEAAVAAASSSKAALAEKKRKRREKEKERKKRKLTHAVDVPQTSVAEQLPNHLSDYLASMQAKSFPKLSSIELHDIRIPASSIVDTTLWTGPRTLDQLVEFIMKILPSLRIRLSQRSKSNGAPTLIYIAAAALRVADVTRILKDKKLRGDKGGDVAKLFAKHFKLLQHIDYLKRTKLGTAVGTPGRLGKLLESDALNVSALTHIILDTTYKDAKNRNLLEIPETRDESFQTVLSQAKIMKGIKDGKIQVILF